MVARTMAQNLYMVKMEWPYTHVHEHVIFWENIVQKSGEFAFFIKQL